MYMDFSLYFFATSAVILLPFVYCVWRKGWILAIFLVANVYLTGLFLIEDDPTWTYTAFLAMGGAIFLVVEGVRQADHNSVGEIQDQQSGEPDEGDSRIHPKIKRMRQLLPANVRERIIRCLKCGGENKVPKNAQSAICPYCGRDALSPA
jgi:hypothetical protein